MYCCFTIILPLEYCLKNKRGGTGITAVLAVGYRDAPEGVPGRKVILPAGAGCLLTNLLPWRHRRRNWVFLWEISTIYSLSGADEQYM